MKQLTVTLDERSYDIHFDLSLAQSGEWLRDCCPKAQRVLVVTDETVETLYANTVTDSLETAGFAVSLLTCAVGEESKSLANLGRVYDALTAAGLTRSDCMLALGGGVIGDLTGFAAASYLRGIDFVQVPTTLLAMVDSSVGGKTAINLPAGKNLVGAFWQPKGVLADMDCLESLTDRNFYSGMAEVIKHGFLADMGLLELLADCEGDRDLLMARMAEVVGICCEMKSQFVTADERDTGVRMLLNLGHTLGHAYEKAGNFEIYTHGEAVAAGLVAAVKLGEQLGVTPTEVRPQAVEMLRAHRLPTEIDCTMAEYEAAIGLDKKGEGEKIHLILLTRAGEAVRHSMTKAELFALIEGVLL